ncbi:MAG: hypothetical protein LBQ74_14665 [Prevotella sp.]|jgi:hypothetical protein|nr:hypothetical protein [Prevotella sp.]
MIPKNPIQTKVFQEFPVYEKFLDRYKPENLIVYYSDINTVEDSIAEKRFSLEDISFLYPPVKKIPAGIDYLSKWITYLQDFLNINNRLTKVQDIATMIYKDNRHFYLSDLTVIFQAILRSEYGRFYGSVDAQTIISSFTLYNVSRYKAYLKSDSAVKQVLENNITEIKRIFRQQLFEEIEKEGKLLSGVEIYNEMEKRFEQRFPEVYQNEYSKLMKETPKLKPSQDQK